MVPDAAKRPHPFARKIEQRNETGLLHRRVARKLFESDELETRFEQALQARDLRGTQRGRRDLRHDPSLPSQK